MYLVYVHIFTCFRTSIFAIFDILSRAYIDDSADLMCFILLFVYGVKLDASRFSPYMVCTLLLAICVRTICLRCCVVKSALTQSSDVWLKCLSYAAAYSQNASIWVWYVMSFFAVYAGLKDREEHKNKNWFILREKGGMIRCVVAYN